MVKKTSCNFLVAYKEPHELDEWIESLYRRCDSVVVHPDNRKIVTRVKHHAANEGCQVIERMYTPLCLQYEKSVYKIAGMRISGVKWLTSDVSLYQLEFIEGRRMGKPTVTFVDE